MIKYLSTLLFLMFALLSFAQTTDTIWLNTKWEKSVKEKAAYYRIINTSVDKNNFKVSDYYLTGEIQMSGNYLSLDTPQIRNGAFTWWYRNGIKKAEHQYENNTPWKETEWDINGKITNQGQYVYVWTMENGKEVQSLARIDLIPEYPGGMPEVYKFIIKNFRYPEDLNPRPVGKIVVRFTVSSKGKVIRPKITQSLSPLLDQEALRIIRIMPNWTPGMQDGKYVDVMMSLPISLK